jgi:hypothetical protein
VAVLRPSLPHLPWTSLRCRWDERTPTMRKRVPASNCVCCECAALHRFRYVSDGHARRSGQSTCVPHYRDAARAPHRMRDLLRVRLQASVDSTLDQPLVWCPVASFLHARLHPSLSPSLPLVLPFVLPLPSLSVYCPLLPPRARAPSLLLSLSASRSLASRSHPYPSPGLPCRGSSRASTRRHQAS